MGYYLLAIAVLVDKEISVEGAERLFYGEKNKTDRDFTAKKMATLKEQGFTYAEISKMFGMYLWTVAYRIKIYNRSVEDERLN